MATLPVTSVVVLAAGSGTRFAGSGARSNAPKQLAAVGADGAAIMDVSLRRAAAAGIGHAVIVVAPGVEAQVRAHVEAIGDPPVPVDLAVQRLHPGRSHPLGTADAVLAARDRVAGSFVVVNGDDLYPQGAFGALAGHLRAAPDDEHAMVAFRVANTLTGDRPVSRALVDVDRASALLAIREGSVVRGAGGLQFEAGTATQPLADGACVSMNMWGFRASIFPALADAVTAFEAEGRSGEAYLPEVVASEVARGVIVRVLVSEEACIGVTYDEDLAAVRTALS